MIVAPHILWHTRATLLTKRGMSKGLLPVFLGHEKPETTPIYMQSGIDIAVGAE